MVTQQLLTEYVMLAAGSHPSHYTFDLASHHTPYGSAADCLYNSSGLSEETTLEDILKLDVGFAERPHKLMDHTGVSNSNQVPGKRMCEKEMVVVSRAGSIADGIVRCG